MVGFRFSRPSTSAAVAAGQDPTSLSLGISAQEINLQMQPCTVENGHPKPPFQVLVPITECLQIFTEEVTELARPLCLRRSEQVTELSWPPHIRCPATQQQLSSGFDTSHQNSVEAESTELSLEPLILWDCHTIQAF